MRNRRLIFLLLATVLCVLILPPLLSYIKSAAPSDFYSHIYFIPIVSGYMIFRERKALFAGAMSAHWLGIVLMIGGGFGLLMSRLIRVNPDVVLPIFTLAGLSLFLGAYLVLFGKTDTPRSLFPLLFLVFLVPIPSPILNTVVHALVVGSTFMTQVLFRVLSVPFVPHGAVIDLPGFSIEVAQECSGIRSSLALLITTVLAGHLFLRRGKTQLLLALFVVPVAMLKNAIRIVTLSLLGGFVDMRILKGGFLHRSGGFVFFGIGLFVMGLILLIIRGLDDGKQSY